MKRIIRIDEQGWTNKLKPEDYLNSIGVSIIKGKYSNYCGCYFFEVKYSNIEFIEEIKVLKTIPSKFNWNL